MKRVVIAALIAAAPAAALGHHGWSEYDASHPLKLTGKILESGYEHPHGFVKLQTSDKTWMVVLAPPSRMEFRGLPADLLKPGGVASIEGYPNRKQGDEVRAERISVGGKTVELR
jgi:hypothetical protein